MQTELVVAGSSDADLIKSLLDEYLLELGSYRDVPSGTITSAPYSYLDAYWSESWSVRIHHSVRRPFRRVCPHPRSGLYRVRRLSTRGVLHQA